MLALARGLVVTLLAVSFAAAPLTRVHASPFSVAGTRVVAPAGDDSGEDPSDDPSATDDPEVAEAKAEYQAGSDAYALGNYEESVRHFERAFELSQEPALLFNLGQSYTRWYDISNDVEHLKLARRLYENYVLNVGSTELDEEQQAQARSDAQRRISEVDRRIANHGSTTDEARKPVHEKAWFWIAIVGGLAVVGGVTAAVVLTTRKPGFEPELGTLGREPVGGGGLTLRF